MDKYQEALENVKYAPSFMGGNPKYAMSMQSSTAFLEDIAILKELVDKENPIKIKGLSATHEGFVANCPNCNSFIRQETSTKRCDECGQKLDWSDAEDDK